MATTDELKDLIKEALVEILADKNKAPAETALPPPPPPAAPVKDYFPDERILVWATVVKTHDRSNYVVEVAGQRFNPSWLGLVAAEPGVDDIVALVGLVDELKAKEKAIRESMSSGGSESPLEPMIAPEDALPARS